ncbi:hypothetical protein McanMca71_005720 [Microsporum canis]|uniref:Uncharacterized protein n=1 Tax=Arthroderma otae (strain ATCC MYA-4605 / CBS 113480) TaxID=554155 RepID=C5FMK3_ARTOC|nr:uncharacterized protein MCYG_03925 [Microsporum canis CBS 113480]EEQ31106.1 predicted protein [Microsporum canis CBS 113480]
MEIPMGYNWNLEDIDLDWDIEGQILTVVGQTGLAGDVYAQGATPAVDHLAGVDVSVLTAMAAITASGAVGQVQQPVAVNYFLALPIHIRQNIYRMLLDCEVTMKHQINEEWDTIEVIDDMADSDTPTDWVWSMCPRLTKYNFSTSILQVNNQIYREAAPFLGRRNLWVLLRIEDRMIAQGMEDMGCAIPVPGDWNLAGLGELSGDVNYFAIDITVGREPHANPARQQFFIMAVDGVWDLVAMLISYCEVPWNIVIRVKVDHHFSHARMQGVLSRIADMLEPLRILEPGDEARRATIVVDDIKFGLSVTPLNHLQTRFEDNELIRMLRNYLPCFNSDVNKVDWRREEVKMAEWSFFFINGINKYGISPDFPKFWRDTLCMAHTRLVAIKLGIDATDEAAFHMQRASDLLEMHEARLWWYRALLAHMGDWEDTLSKSANEEILDAIWCLSKNEDKQWFNLFWLHGKGNEENARRIVLTVAHKMEAVRLMAGNGPDSVNERPKIFHRLMGTHGQRLADSLQPEEMDEHNLSMRVFRVSNNSPESLQVLCYYNKINFWSLV